MMNPIGAAVQLS